MFDELDSDLVPEECPSCGSNHTYFDRAFNFHKCEDCSLMWGFDSDDPDYDEDLYEDMKADQMAENLKDPIEDF
ncbi:hypothetical protein [Aliterella atlantica]|uniref:hypothetical protein n=1 Tax=Aliterella atlantica TaxID=1827278 RepID=UPI0011865207|nr:hypothetical protein [Aliterella atlantica]